LRVRPAHYLLYRALSDLASPYPFLIAPLMNMDISFKAKPASYSILIKCCINYKTADRPMIRPEIFPYKAASGETT
jgi:hypothetical protein